jgi:putative zinc finger/helix-turn-helix YgiT family protein
MSTSEICVHDTRSEVLPVHLSLEFGIPLRLHKAVQCSRCAHCGLVTHSIPYPEKLAAAAAVYRSMIPEKLSGKEIRFIRKSLGYTAKEMAAALEIAPETFSRWENGHAAINPSSERLLRINAGIKLAHLAPAIVFNVADIVEMDIKAALGNKPEIVLDLQLVTFKNTAQDEPRKEYTPEKKAA